MGKWKLVALNERDWELYDMEADRTEMNEISKEFPEQRQKMIKMYAAWAKHCHVLPGRPKREAGFTPPQRPYPKMADY